jgi:hypothetical protein
MDACFAHTILKFYRLNIFQIPIQIRTSYVQDWSLNANKPRNTKNWTPRNTSAPRKDLIGETKLTNKSNYPKSLSYSKNDATVTSSETEANDDDGFIVVKHRK